MCEMVRHQGAKSMIGFSTILCVSEELLRAIGVELQFSIPNWPYDLVARIYDAPRHCNRRKQWANPPHLTELDVLFSGFFVALGLLFWKLPLGSLGFGFNVIAIHPWFVTSYDLFEQFWIIVERRQLLLIDVHATLFCSKFSDFGIIFPAARFMAKTFVKIAWHEPNDMPASSAMFLIRRLSKIIFFTASMFSSVVDLLGRPGRVLSLTFIRPSLNRLYHNRTCVLLIVDSPNATVNILNVLAHFISFFTQNLIHFFSNTRSKKSKSTPKHD